MMKLFLFFILFIRVINSQDFHSPESRKLFADYLFCTQDYLRATSEYEEYLKFYDNDTSTFKVALGYSLIKSYEEAAKKFSEISTKSNFYHASRLEYLKTQLLLENYAALVKFPPDSNQINELKLINLSILLSDSKILERDKLLNPFLNKEKSEVEMFYKFRKDPPYKSPVIAGLMSAVIPGSGKIYADQLSEGLTALVLNGLFAFLSYNNFKHDHDFRGWIFAGAGTFFYAGNIYGSVAAAKIYNSKLDYEYKEQVLDFLESNNYFIEEYDFCN